MAEVLGVVASGIAVAQIAGQIANTIIKLKSYWSQIKEAPAEINHLLREIESLNLMLQHMQEDQAQQSILSSHNLCVQRSLKLCEECASELSGLANDFAVRLHGKSSWKRKVSSAKVVLSEDEIKKLKRRLKTAMRMLSLSYQLHTGQAWSQPPDVSHF